MLMAPLGIPTLLPHARSSSLWRALWLSVSLVPLAIFLAAMITEDADPVCVWLCPELLSCVEQIR
jgi:hypothetical protein